MEYGRGMLLCQENLANLPLKTHSSFSDIVHLPLDVRHSFSLSTLVSDCKNVRCTLGM